MTTPFKTASSFCNVLLGLATDEWAQMAKKWPYLFEYGHFEINTAKNG